MMSPIEQELEQLYTKMGVAVVTIDQLDEMEKKEVS